MQNDFTKLLLPSAVFEHFELISIEVYPEHFILRLDEKDLPPHKHNHTYTSKGFFPGVEIQDFPLRGNPFTFTCENENGLKNK